MLRLLSLSAALLAVVAAAPLLSSRVDGHDAVIALAPTRTHQTMRGWEVTARLWELHKEQDRYDPSWIQYRDELLSRLVNELGIDRVRLEVRSGFENPVDHWTAFEQGRIGYRTLKRHWYEAINDNDDPRRANRAAFQFAELDWRTENIVLPLKRLVEANGERLFVTLTYVDFGRPGTNGPLSHARHPEEYAELIHAAFEHLRSRFGLVPDALEIVLEPDNTDHWRGPAIGAAMLAAVRRLRPAGFAPEVIVPSTAAARAAVAYIDAMMDVPGAAGVPSMFAYHRYDRWGVGGEVLPKIRERANRYGVLTAMLEHLSGSVVELHEDLTTANVSAWQQYAIAARASAGTDERGGAYYIVDVGRRAAPAIRMAPRTRALAQYFRFVRTGAVRIGVASTRADQRVVAFRNADGTHVVIVQALRGGTMSVTGLPAGSYGIRYTTAEEAGRELPATSVGAGHALAAHLPAAGVITVYQRAVRGEGAADRWTSPPSEAPGPAGGGARR